MSAGPNRSPWPWLALAAIVAVLVWLFATADAPAPSPRYPASIVYQATPVAVPALLTALAAMPGSAGNPMVLATIPATPTETPLPRRDTPTPWPACPAAAGVVCVWPEMPPTPRLRPTATAYAACRTPIPEERCRMPEGTP